MRVKKKFEQISSQRLHSGFLKVDSHVIRHESFNGGWCPEIVRERLEGLNAVSVLLYDPQLDQVVLVEQFRVGALGVAQEPWLLETIGGYRAPGELPEAVAKRETLEESGLEIEALQHICDFYVSPGVSSERIGLYCAKVDSSRAGGVHGLEHEGEEVRVVVHKFEQAKQELFKRLNSTSVIIAMQWLINNHEQIRGQWQIS